MTMPRLLWKRLIWMMIVKDMIIILKQRKARTFRLRRNLLLLKLKISQYNMPTNCKAIKDHSSKIMTSTNIIKIFRPNRWRRVRAKRIKIPAQLSSLPPRIHSNNYIVLQDKTLYHILHFRVMTLKIFKFLCALKKYNLKRFIMARIMCTFKAVWCKIQMYFLHNRM